MKSNLLLLFIVGLYGGCISEAVTPCIEERIDQFKLDMGAESIIKIERPEGLLYWFVDEVADGSEDVLTEDCSLFCITDCYCVLKGCDEAIFDLPRKIIWTK